MWIALALRWISGGWGIGMGYHRLLTHRGYETPRWLECILPENSHWRGISGKSCLSPNRPNVGQRAFRNSLARRRSAGTDDGVPPLGKLPQCDRSLVPQLV